MYLMSTSTVALRGNLIFLDDARLRRHHHSRGGAPAFHMFAFMPPWSPQRRRSFLRLVGNCKKKGRLKRRTWWQKFFLDGDDGSWFSWSAEDVLGADGLGEEHEDEDEQDDERFESWKSRAEAIIELREAQEDARIEEGLACEDWLGGDGLAGGDSSSWGQDSGSEEEQLNEVNDDPEEIMREKGILGAIKDSIVDDDDRLLFEDRVFQYASTSSAKFVAFLILIPWALDFMVHDFVLMPFLDRYVKLVPLAAEMLDVSREQKLEMIKTLKLEKARLRLEVEIGKSPPLSDEEVWLEMRHKAIELRDEWRLENRKAFANIWSDLVYGITLFLLIYFNKSKVALLKFTGYKLLNNISDTGKAFLIILITDIFLGYHSESGWQALIEIIVEHYGIEIDKAAITIFICSVPVFIDACVKFWLHENSVKLTFNCMELVISQNNNAVDHIKVIRHHLYGTKNAAMSDAGERKQKSILKLARIFSGFGGYDSAAGPKPHAECAPAASRYSRIFAAGDGAVGLGIVASMTALPRSQPIRIAAAMTKPWPGSTFLKDKEDIAELSESYTCVIWHLGDNGVRKRVYLNLGGGDNGLLLERALLPIEQLAEPPVAVAEFLKCCFNFKCRKKLYGMDAYFYSGEAFCSEECRY
ncbi:hypothetical protein Cni_G14234 [Canna indica]|uniref:FLZ-type domain-containing protein n=1 Tax=Canna indica TaxID=4628 RepID=A0AAQ3QEJ6_9LILI|nr:hypothetical protein Cni_G14234 [Canna indica]